MTEDTATCPPELMSQALDMLRTDDVGGLARLDTLLGDYPEDAQLHFLRGSILAGLQHYDDARKAMGRAVELAPLFAVARFQLGLLELSSGDGSAADETLAPLEQLGGTNPLAILARGLRHLMRDQFDNALAALREGVARNTENPAINRDMGLLIAELEQKVGGGGGPVGDEPTTSTHMLLQQLAAKGPKH